MSIKIEVDNAQELIALLAVIQPSPTSVSEEVKRQIETFMQRFYGSTKAS